MEALIIRIVYNKKGHKQLYSKRVTGFSSGKKEIWLKTRVPPKIYIKSYSYCCSENSIEGILEFFYRNWQTIEVIYFNKNSSTFHFNRYEYVYEDYPSQEDWTIDLIPEKCIFPLDSNDLDFNVKEVWYCFKTAGQSSFSLAFENFLRICIISHQLLFLITFSS